jgi:hypothetical protein
LAIEKKRTDFGFGGRGHNVAQNVADGVDWAVEAWFGRPFGEISWHVASKEMPTGSAA